MRSGVFVRGGDVVNALRNKRNVLKGKVHNPSGWTAWMRAASMAIATAGAMVASTSFAASTTVNVLIDADNNAGTGCTISTANGPFAGVDRVLNTLVVSDTNGYRITSISMQSCVGNSLNAPTVFDPSSTALARGNGVNGTTAVETYIPSLYLPAEGQKMRVGITTTGADGLVGTDALTLTAGGPILVDGPPLVVIPTLAKMSLALTALLLALSVWFARRRGWHGLQMVFVAAFALSISGQLIAAIVRDGFIVDWQGIPAAAVDPAGDSPAGTDITNLYSTVENGNVFFRVDTVLNAPPVANAQSVIAVVGQSVPVTLTGADYEASPLAFTVVTPPVQGVLAGAAPNLTYTPNANATSSDSFTFKANDGLLDSAPATVSIDIKRPPTITSANSTVFVPGQANSFSFTATGVPPATFALSACAPALPASINFANNGNNTATLAGNPTVGQGGTYVCTLTASNGFGTNATQPFTLNVGLPPTFTSANGTTFATGTAGTFTVSTTSTPATTSITQSGALPSGVTFSYVSGLNATLAGTPAAGTGGTYPITLTAGNGIPPNSSQVFSLTVNQAPAITSANSLTCIVGVACSLPTAATGFPLPTIAIGGVALPAGIAYAAGTPGNGTLSGTPSIGTVGTYPLTFTASNTTAPNAVQNFTLTVNKATTTTALVSSQNPSISGQSVTFTATVTPQGAGVPTGGVTFNDGATAICSNVPVNGAGVATCTTSALSVAASPHSVAAVYAGDASFTTSTSSAVNQVVNKANTSTALVSSSNPSNFGQSVTFTATVTAVAPGGGTPTGSITFNDGAASLCANVAVNGAGVATCTTAALGTATSPHSVTAIYGGDANFTASPASVAVSQVVNKAATTTALASGTNPSVFGQSVTFTATVTVTAPGAGTPTGTINFTDGAATVCPNVAVNGAGIASCTTSTLSVGGSPHSVLATYSGDASFNGSANTPLSQTVTKAGTTTALAFGANPSVSGQSVSFTATIAPVAPGAGTPTGTVSFSDGATVICGAVVVSSSQATCTTSALTAAASPHSMTASYTGDGNFNPSASAALSQVVNKADATSTVTSSKTPTVSGESVTFTAAVTPVAPGAGIPSGTVTFNDGATPICNNVALVAGGATCATTALTVTSHTITVVYSGDAAFNTSTSAAITQVVGLAGSTAALVTSGSPSTAGSSVTFTATVSPVAPAVGTPAGTVNFTSDTVTIAGCGTVALVGGVATCSTSALAVGSRTIAAVYSGSAGFGTSTSANLTQAVIPGPATHFTVSAPSSTVSGTTFNVTVTALDALNNVATGYRGTAHFTSTDGAATLPADYTFTAGDNGVKVLSATLRTAGSRTITGTDSVTVSITGVSGAISVVAAGAARFSVSAPGSTTAGTALSFTVTALDAFNNIATSYVGTAKFTSTDGAATLPANYTFVAGDNGVHTFASGATLKTAGLRTLTATDTGNATITGTSAAITVNAGAATRFSVVAPANATSGAAFNFTVTALDAFNNTATSYGGTAHFTSTDGISTLPVDSTLTSGVGTFSATLKTAGSQTVTATDTVTALITGTSNPIAVSAGAATSFTVVAPANATSNTAFNVTVTARDAFNNTATGYSGTVHFTSSDGSATLPANSTLTAGVGVFSVTMQTLGSQTVTATDTVSNGINGTSNLISVAAPLLITGNPANQSVNAGQTATFSASATGTPSPTVQWQVSTDGGGTFNNVAGATSTTLSFTAVAGQNGNQFRAVFTSGANTANTSVATLTVIAPNQAPSATGFTGLPAQAGITITYPAGKLGGTDPEGGAVTVATPPDMLCAGCALTLRADGGFDFTPTPAMAGTTQSFTYHVTDNGIPAPVLNSPAVTVSFTVAGPAIYFVKSAAVGTGNCTLGNECTLSTALTAIGASTSAHIFLSDANTHSTASVTHNSGGRIIGQGVSGASFDAVFGIAAPAQGTLATRPAINQTKPTVNSTITAHNASHVRGLIIKPAAGANKGLVASGKAGLVLSELAIDMTANGATGNALEFVNTSGDYTGGGLVITATSGKGVTATGGGTVTVQGTGNKVTTTTGTALEVNGSNIGASHMTFESISSGTAASGPANGILLSSTGASGRLIVTGTGAVGSGGTIQKSTGAGVSLSSTNGPSLSWMTVSGSTGSGINGTSVTGSMLLDRLTVSGNSTLASTNCAPISICQAGIFFYNLTGSGHAISNSTIFGSAENNIHVENDGANALGGLTLTGNTIRDNAGLGGLGNGLHIKANGTASMTVTATSNVFAANLGTAIQADAGGTTNAINLTATNNAMHNAGVTSTQGGTGIGMSVNANTTPTLTFNITGNTIGKNGATNAPLGSNGITISENSTAHSTVTGNITNNTIFGAGAAAVGGGIRVFPAGVTGSSWKVRVDGNTLSNIGAGYGIFVGSGEQTPTGDSDVQVGVINNNVAVLTTAFDAIRVQSRNTGTMCARVTGNTGSHVGGGCANNLAGLGFCGIQVRQANTSIFNLEGGGTNANIFANNPGTPQSENAFAGTITTVAANSCNQIP